MSIVGVLLDPEVFPEAVDRGRARIDMISELMGLLEENEVDVVILNDAPPGLAREVVTTGVRVFVANEERTKDFVRDVQQRAADLDPFLDRVRAAEPGVSDSMTYLVERLKDLRRHLDHLAEIRAQVSDASSLDAPIDMQGEFELRWTNFHRMEGFRALPAAPHLQSTSPATNFP